MKTYALLVFASALTLGACDRAGGSKTQSKEPIAADPSPAEPSTAASSSPADDHRLVPAPSPSALAEEPAIPGAPPESEKGEKAARGVLLTWARALENHDFRTAWAQFGSPPSTLADYTRWWSRYRTITVAVPTGTMDAGAGSIYYTSHATLTGVDMAGKPYRLEGDVMLRRVNDVPGATPAQLRWHIGTANLQSVAAP